MIYSKLYQPERFKIPTILGLLLVLFIIIFFARIMSSVSTPSRASKKTVKRVEVTNLSPFEATIFWQTDKTETGWLLLGSKVAIDERDTSDKKNTFINHYVILRNLQENTGYDFKIVSSNKLITNINDTPFSFRTPASTQLFQSQNPAYGKVMQSNMQPLDNAIVLVSFDNGFSLSTLTKPTGEWLVPLSAVYQKNTLKTKSLSNKEKIKIEIMSEDGQTSTILTNLDKISPLPQTTIIGQNYDFFGVQNVLSAQSGASGLNQQVDIIYPKEGALIPGRIPLIKGTSLPNSEVLVDSVKVMSDATGVWSYLPPQPLTLGQHTITVSAKNSAGNQVIITRNFVIVGGEGPDAKVLGASTEATPTVLPTYSLSPTVATASPKPPVSGGGGLAPAISGASLIILGLGFILAF